MPGFNAGKAVPKLDWDFTDFAGPDDKGTIPEPSDDALDAFRDRLRDVYGADFDPTDEAAVAQRMREIDAEAASLEVLDATAELCQECPSTDQLRALPPRVRAAFLGWLLQSITNPTGTAPAVAGSH